MLTSANDERIDAGLALRIIESMPGYAWSADPSGRFTYVSPGTLAYLGTDTTGLNEGDEFGWRQHVHPDDYERVAGRWRHCLRTGEHYDTEHRLRRADGVYRWHRNSGLPSRDAQGRIVQWFGTTLDIDDQKRAEEALRTRERELQQLIDMVPSHLWRLTPDGEPVFFNRRMTDYLGMDVADTERPGMTRLAAMIEAAVHPDDARAFGETLGRSLTTGEPFALKYRLRRHDGVYRWMSSRAEPLRDTAGGIVQWYGLCHDIDDQRQAEDALRARERELSQLIDFVPVQIGRMSPAGETTFLSKRTIDYIGLEDIASWDEPGRRRIDALVAGSVHPDDQPRLIEKLGHALSTGEPYAIRFRIRRADGAYRWHDGRAVPFRDADGAIVQWYHASIDIDDQVRTEEALHDRERELQQLIDTVPVQIWCVDPGGEPSYINKTMVDYIGLDLSFFNAQGGLREAIGTIVHPEDRARLGAALQHSFTTGEPFALTFRNRRRDGSYRWTQGNAAPARDQTGRITRWYGVNVDIDDQVRLFSDLQEREARIRRLIDSDIIGIVFWDIDGTLIDANDAFLRMVQYDRDDVKAGLRWFDMTPPDWQEVHAREEAEELMRTGRMQAREKEYFRKDGSRVPVLIGGAFFEGHSTQGVAFILDLTERKRAEAAQLRAEEALRRSSEKLARTVQAASLAELSASIAHEVNQPLAAVVANAYACQRWLMADPPNLERAQRTVERIIRDANAASDVVGRIRALFRQGVEARTSAAMGSIVAEARDLMAEELARKGVRVDVAVADDVPAVVVDRVQIQQVLVNVMRNGIEAMELIAGERTLTLNISRAGDLVRTEIVDQGLGVANPERIFEPFFTTKGAGMGMGLAICRSIVESHGGRLWAESAQPRGARFVFTLPILEQGAQ